MAKTRQLKVSVEPGVAEGFKSACATSGVSMASELSRFMIGRTDTHAAARAHDKTSTRARRRKTVHETIALLYAVAEAENAYLERMPENLSASTAHDAAQAAVDALEDAISILDGAFE